MKKYILFGVLVGVFLVAVAYFGGKFIGHLTTPKVQEVKPTCEIASENGHINRGHCLPVGFSPEVLPLSRRVSWLNTAQYLDIKGKVMVEQLIESAESVGMCLVVTSGYRSYGDQEELYNDTSEDKRIYVAKPGESEHQTGLAVDLTACPMKNGVRDDSIARNDLTNEFETLPEYKWLTENASRYGFEQSYTAENIADTQYTVESWHWKLIIK